MKTKKALGKGLKTLVSIEGKKMPETWLKMERDKELSKSAKKIISAKTSEIKRLKSLEEEVHPPGLSDVLMESLKEKDVLLSESAEKISTLEAKVKESEEELEKKDEIISAKASEIKELKPQHEEIDILKKIKKDLEEKKKTLTKKEARLSRSIDKISALKANSKVLETELKEKGIEELNVLRGVKKTIGEKDALLSGSAKWISTLEAKVKESEEELRKKEKELNQIKQERKKKEVVEHLYQRLYPTLGEKDALLSGSAKWVSTLEAKVKESEEELRKKEKELNQMEHLYQRLYPRALKGIDTQLKSATIEKKSTARLLDQLAEQASQISEGEYKLKKKMYTEKVETISRSITELKKLKEDMSRVIRLNA